MLRLYSLFDDIVHEAVRIWLCLFERHECSKLKLTMSTASYYCKMFASSALSAVEPLIPTRETYTKNKLKTTRKNIDININKHN